MQSLSSAPVVLPAPVGAVLRHLPHWPGAALFCSALNAALAPQLPHDVRQALQGRTLRIEVKDAGIGFDFAWQQAHARFVAASPRRTQPDLTIRAHATDFVALARRTQDPDTLFFNRRLIMEGDTELGLMVKNTLDALELPVFDLRQLPLPDPARLPLPAPLKHAAQRLRERWLAR